MRFVIQRVIEAKVTVDEQIVGKIGKGLMILVGLTGDDKDEYIHHVTDKFLNLRLWDDDKGVRWKESVKTLGLDILLVSQFTLYSHMKGNKPDFHMAMENDKAKVMFEMVVNTIKKKYDPNKIQTGSFGAYMQVSLINDGPVTIEWEYPGDKIESISTAQKDKEKANANKKQQKVKGTDKQSKEDNKKNNDTTSTITNAPITDQVKEEPKDTIEKP